MSESISVGSLRRSVEGGRTVCFFPCKQTEEQTRLQLSTATSCLKELLTHYH